ncbi:SMP-30/gluconolactonase/LRE family protein [Hyphococcus sp.]|uniref:SMP-30/gluconolactonase/LRE family protein n=1 Tax=Hyphococcus sp. TaxID=2038636 RepID=UPI003CCBE089
MRMAAYFRVFTILTDMPDLTFTAPQCIAPVAAVLGEGPIWSPSERRLYWLDIKGKRLFAYDPAKKSTAAFETPAMVSALGLARGADFICAREDGLFLLDLKDGALCFHKIADPEADLPGNRFNDGKVDPGGAFWAGGMDNAEDDVTGAWWRLTPDGETRKMHGGFHVPNGPAFDHARRRIYLTDSAKRTIYIRDEDESAGLCVHRVFEERHGYPDGMDVDRHGRLWVAFWDGGCIRCLSPEGDILHQIDIPAPRPTSLAIVDNAIYVTSASIGLSDEQRNHAPASGGLFHIAVSEPIGAEKCFYFDARNLKPRKT